MMLADQGQSWKEELGNQRELSAGPSQGLLSVWAALQVPGQRPHPDPVQCHPVPPERLPWTIWEGPAGGGPGGHGE